MVPHEQSHASSLHPQLLSVLRFEARTSVDGHAEGVQPARHPGRVQFLSSLVQSVALHNGKLIITSGWDRKVKFCRGRALTDLHLMSHTSALAVVTCYMYFSCSSLSESVRWATYLNMAASQQIKPEIHSQLQ